MQRLRCAIPHVLWVLPLLGCYSYRTITAKVVDAETGQPISGAVVRTDYNQGLWHVAPSTSRGVTGTNGTTRIRVAKDPNGIPISPEADGYLDYWGDGVYPDGRPYSTPYTELPRWPFDAVTLSLYAEPAPQVVLIVPDGYTGPIPVGTGYGKRGNPWPGRRIFEVPWKPGRTVSLRDLPQMNGSPLTVTSVRYASGRDLPFGIPRTEGIAWWRMPGGLFIGSWEERHELHRAVAGAGNTDWSPG